MRPPLAEALDLQPHPEGGWYRQTWRAPVSLRPDGYPGARHAATAIYFLLMPGERSGWHRVRSDELWLWHSGGPLRLSSGAEPMAERSYVLGPDVDAGQCPQVIVPGGQWQAAEPAGAEHVLVSCVVSPGFEFDDFELL